MEAKFPVLSKNMPITIHASLLAALVFLIIAISRKVTHWEAELELLQKKAKYNWSLQMEKDVWDMYFHDKEKLPDIDRIRGRYRFYTNDE